MKELSDKENAWKKEANKGSKAEQKAKKKAMTEKVAALVVEMKKKHEKELSSLETETVPSDNTAKEPKGKVSKSQKKKEKRLQEEAEREQRILEEKKGVVSLRAQELQALHEKLSPEGLKIKEIKPDGHCLYRAVEDQLALGGSLQSMESLRSLTASYMRQHFEDFLPFLTAELLERPGSESHEEDLKSKYQSYCNEVESTAAWGGHVELEALSKALNRPIVVISAFSKDLVMGNNIEGTEPLRVCYHRHEFGLGEHYNSVVPLDP